MRLKEFFDKHPESRGDVLSLSPSVRRSMIRRLDRFCRITPPTPGDCADFLSSFFSISDNERDRSIIFKIVHQIFDDQVKNLLKGG